MHSNGSCDCDACSSSDADLALEIAMGPDQTWLATWGDGDYKTSSWFTKDDGMRKWMRARPVMVRDIMRKFPPECVLRAIPGADPRVPARGYVGICGGYAYDPDTGRYDLAIRHTPNSKAGAIVDPAQVEVVGYRAGLTSEAVSRILCDA